MLHEHVLQVNNPLKVVLGQFASPYFVTRSPATLNVARSRSPHFPDLLASPPVELARRSTPRVAGFLVPRLARNLTQYRAQIDPLPHEANRYGRLHRRHPG